MRAQHSRWAWGRAKSVAVVVFAPLATSLPPPALSGREERDERKRDIEGESKREKHISSSPVESNHAKPQIRRDPPETIARDRACVPACERAVLTVSCGQGPHCAATSGHPAQRLYWSPCGVAPQRDRGSRGLLVLQHTSRMGRNHSWGGRLTSARHGCGGQAGCPWGRW